MADTISPPAAKPEVTPKPETPDPEAAPPPSPAAVKKTPLKTPREIELEKKLSVVEDKLTTLEGWQKEVNSWMEGLDLNAGKAVPVPIYDKKAARKGFLHDVAVDLGLES